LFAAVKTGKTVARLPTVPHTLIAD